jgi:small-conductance mechanosensitive channel
MKLVPELLRQKQAGWYCLVLTAGILFTLFVLPAYAQQPPDTTLSPGKKKEEALRKLFREEVNNTRAIYEEHKLFAEQDVLLEQVLQTMRGARNYLKAGIDTNGINRELADINARYNIAVDGIFTNQGSLQTERNLTTSYKLLHELESRAQKRKAQTEGYRRRLLGFRNSFDSLSSNPHLFALAKDSAEFMDDVKQLTMVAQEAQPVDSALNLALRNVQRTKQQVDLTVYRLQSALEQLDHYERQLSEKTFSQEVPGLDEVPQNVRPFREIVRQSGKKHALSLLFYARNNAGKLVILVLLTGFAIGFLRTLKQKVKNHGLLRNDFTGQLVLRHPVLSSIMIVLSIFQFIFPNPPFVFSCILWVISSTCLTLIFRGFITRYWMIFWCAMWFLFLAACADNLLLQASRTERWLMLGIAAGGMLLGASVLSAGRRAELRERSIIWFILFIVVVESISILANVNGRFNLAKALMASGFISVIIAIMFLWTVRLINEALMLASEIFQSPERKLFFINFDVVGKRAPTFFYIFLVIGWFILFARNFYAFKMVTEPFEAFLFDQRKVGAYSFSFFSVLAFFAILLLASVISKIVSFFATDAPHRQTDSGGAKPGLGSWILLVRIGIVVLGLLLAFAVAGIPLDKATFVLGALGVGIGFGLQSLVNNLVSGVILAFEKPLNVGDLVEVKGKAGTVKSIGFRSSVLQTLEGSHLVIPNGELLNDQLVNWNMSNSTRRNEIIVGVAYDTDLNKVKSILMELMMANERIIKNPEPIVFANSFGDSAIEIQVFFWTLTLRTGKAVKSEMIFAIQDAFRQHGVVIPFPQRDVHVKPGPEEE